MGFINVKGNNPSNYHFVGTRSWLEFRKVLRLHPKSKNPWTPAFSNWTPDLVWASVLSNFGAESEELHHHYCGTISLLAIPRARWRWEQPNWRASLGNRADFSSRTYSIKARRIWFGTLQPTRAWRPRTQDFEKSERSKLSSVWELWAWSFGEPEKNPSFFKTSRK